ncbi:MAG: MaoC family dehydratase [Gammaproteobacteria bacterium]
MSLQSALETLRAQCGQETHVSDWLLVDQDRIQAFADATGDHQWIHVDPARAAAESPWKATIAHGYLSLSLYPTLRGIVEEGKPLFPGVRQVINYGLNKLRFTNAVKAGSRVRGRFAVVAVEEVSGGLQLTEQFTLEVEGSTKPAVIAEVLMRFYF